MKGPPHGTGINYGSALSNFSPTIQGSRPPSSQGTSLPPCDNHRVRNLQFAIRAYAKGRMNPIDKRTGKRMVCRSEGCSSIERFQFSGRCLVEQSRREQGLSAVHMADTITEDLENGGDISERLSELLLSRVHKEVDVPSPEENVPTESVQTGFVGLDSDSSILDNMTLQNGRLMYRQA